MDYAKLILILIVLIIKCGAGELNRTDNPHIIFTSLPSSKKQQALFYTVVANKPLYLHFQNMSRGWCYNYYIHEDNLDKGEPPTIKNSTISFSNVTHNMSALWKCKVVEYNNGYYDNYQVYYLNLHVKGAKSVEITANGKDLTFSEADLSAPYDGDTNYFYEHGEHVQIVCRNPHSTGSVHLEYFTKGATNISDSATFFIQLYSRSNSSYIECVYYNTTEPADKYVYRVTLIVTKKRFLYLNESNILSDRHISANKGSKSSSPILGSSIGVVLIILGLTGVACWYVRTRNAKNIKTPNADLSNHKDSPIPQCTKECENQHYSCHYSENLSNRETYYGTPGSVENNMDSEDHYYAKVDYSRCKPKIGERPTRDSKVYDEPYVQITVRDGMQELQQV